MTGPTVRVGSGLSVSSNTASGRARRSGPPLRGLLGAPSRRAVCSHVWSASRGWPRTCWTPQSRWDMPSKGALWPWGKPSANKTSEIKRKALRRSQDTRNLKRTPEQWGKVQRRNHGPPRDVSEIPLDSKALLNPRETLSALYLSRQRLQGHSYRIRDDPDRWAHFQRYLGLLPQHAPPARGDYVQPRHLWEVQSGKARGPDLRLPEADVCIDMAWYQHLPGVDQETLCAVVRSPPVSRTVGRRGRVTLLLKDPDQPVREANLRGITISSHVSKLEPTAFYAVATAIYEQALGGPCLVGGMQGVSLQEVVRKVHMKLDQARLQRHVVDVLITDLAKYFDVIAQDIHPIVGAWVGPGKADHLATHTEGFSYTLPLGPWQSGTVAQLLGTP